VLVRATSVCYYILLPVLASLPSVPFPSLLTLPHLHLQGHDGAHYPHRPADKTRHHIACHVDYVVVQQRTPLKGEEGRRGSSLLIQRGV